MIIKAKKFLLVLIYMMRIIVKSLILSLFLSIMWEIMMNRRTKIPIKMIGLQKKEMMKRKITKKKKIMKREITKKKKIILKKENMNKAYQ